LLVSLPHSRRRTYDAVKLPFTDIGSRPGRNRRAPLGECQQPARNRSSMSPNWSTPVWGCWSKRRVRPLPGRQRRRLGRGPHAQAAGGCGLYLPHRLRSARRSEGADGAARHAQGDRLQANAVGRHQRFQPARRCALRYRGSPGAGATVPLHHPPGAGQRARTDQRRRTGGVEAQDPLA